MTESPYVFNVNADDFARVVVEGSRERPVLVDFWASWCQPCQILMPLLARLADDYHGAFHLAKVDTEANPDLSAQYGIRGIPAVKLFKNGEVIDEFTGALPEAEIRAFLDRHIERESEQLAERALALAQRGEKEAARGLAREALARDPAHVPTVARVARALIAADDPQAAREALGELSPAQRMEDEIKAVETELELREASAELPAADALARRLEEQPGDPELRFRLAQRLAAEERHEEALEQLLTSMREHPHWNDDAARKLMLKLFDRLGADPLVSRYRGRMASLLH